MHSQSNIKTILSDPTPDIIKYKLLYEFYGSKFIGDVTHFNLITKTATILHNIENKQIVLEVGYNTPNHKLLEYSKYKDQLNNELYELDLVEVPGFWKGIIRKHKNIFVIELLKNKEAYINLHEIFSHDHIIPSLTKLGTIIDLEVN